jgi:presenilin-like A22 family membrane protease
MASSERSDDVVIDYPNRDKSSSKATKLVVVLLLLVTAALMAIVTIGGWDKLQGAKILQVAYILLFLICAFYIARWRSGLLPVAAALAIILLIFAAVSGPEWFARDKDGFEQPALDASILGLITLILVPVEVLVIAFAMSGFRQNWQVEVERRADDDGKRRDDDRRQEDSGGGAVAAPA